MDSMQEFLREYLQKWDLAIDGETFSTSSGMLVSVLQHNKPAFLKIFMHDEERRGIALLKWWDGHAAVKVYQSDENAVLMEKADGNRSLPVMVNQGDEEGATRIICSTALKLHSIKHTFVPDLIPLHEWFRSLYERAETLGGIYVHTLPIADELLHDQVNITALHGDLHHQNILDGGERGWLAIDPKGIIGDHAFDYTPLFCNPDLHLASSKGRLAERVKVVSEITGITPVRLLKWIVAYASLSSVWMMEDGEDPAENLNIAHIAYAELNV